MDFYLGTRPDGDPHVTADRVMYDPDDLTTHGVIVGMTGSGKTGLGIIYLEEALRQGIPTLVIDPKGDMTNLLLTFPELRSEDFLPWIDESDAKREGLSPGDAAAAEAKKWSDGLASSGLGPDDIAALRATAGMSIYTPGSRAGIPIDVVGRLDVPELDWDADAEVMRDEIEGFASGLLGLVDVDADPISSREHILIANLVEHSWRNGRALTLESLIRQITTPPLRKLGVFDIDTFFPEKDRTALAMRLNGLLASPAFAAWMDGEPLDIESLLWKGDEPQAAVMYLAHLSDAERQFIVTTIFSKLITWMRSQAGSTTLRVLVYMDEVFGFVPPTAAPPAKKPILTILKQARAFGVGLVLSTQNPVDLDYKAMSNAGTWCVGRLQTERDKARILEAVTAASGDVDVPAIDAMISNLASREFLLHNTRDRHPEILGTRWAMSYLRGPMTRDEVERITDPSRRPPTSRSNDEDTEVAATEPAGPPPVADGVEQYAVHPSAAWATVAGFDDDASTWRAGIALTVRCRFDEARADVEHTMDWEAIVFPAPVDPDRATFIEVDHDERDFTSLPETANLDPGEVPLESASYFSAIEKAAVRHLDTTATLPLLINRELRVTARPGESESEFRARVSQAADNAADEEMAKLRDRYEARFRKARRTYDDAVRSAQTAAGELDSAQQEAVLGLGLDLLMGRKPSRSRSSRSVETRLRRAEDKVESARRAYEDLDADLADRIESIQQSWDDRASEIEQLEVGLEADDIHVASRKVIWVRN